MSSIIKVDQIQLADGSTPTAGDLGLNTTGSVLQVKQSHLTAPLSNNSASWSNLTSLTITPSSTSSKILLIADIQTSGFGTTNGFRFTKDGSAIGIGDANSNRSRVSFGGHESSAGSLTYVQYHQKTVGSKYLDSPSTTNQITYAVQWANLNQNSNYSNVNRSHGYDDSATGWDVTSTSSFILMEIAG